MLTDLSRTQGIADCLAKFAIDAASMLAMQTHYGHLEPQAFNELVKRRLQAEGTSLPQNFDQQVAAHDAISANAGEVVRPKANAIPAGDSRWGPAPVKPGAPVPGAPLPSITAPGQKPTITAPSFADPTTQQPNAPKELGYHPPPVAGVPVGGAAGTGVGRDPRLLHRVKVR